ncbi:hypothetical protein GQ44DRAFT_552752, partial [Phaeosphaeriaceae sp. PMI808]
VAVFGESQVGKTCFVDMLITSRHFSEHYGVTDSNYRYKMTIGDEVMEADFMDLSSTAVRTADETFSADFFVSTLSRAAGIILLYDVTSRESFEHITNQAFMYACMCKQYMGNDTQG